MSDRLPPKGEWETFTDALQSGAEKYRVPPGWSVEEASGARLTYRHVELPVDLVVTVKPRTAIGDLTNHARVKTYGGVTVGIFRYDRRTPVVLDWCQDWMRDNPYPIGLFEGDAVLWHPGKTPIPSKHHPNIGAVRVPDEGTEGQA